MIFTVVYSTGTELAIVCLRITAVDMIPYELFLY